MGKKGREEKAYRHSPKGSADGTFEETSPAPFYRIGRPENSRRLLKATMFRTFSNIS